MSYTQCRYRESGNHSLKKMDPRISEDYKLIQNDKAIILIYKMSFNV